MRPRRWTPSWRGGAGECQLPGLHEPTERLRHLCPRIPECFRAPALPRLLFEGGLRGTGFGRTAHGEGSGHRGPGSSLLQHQCRGSELGLLERPGLPSRGSKRPCGACPVPERPRLPEPDRWWQGLRHVHREPRPAAQQRLPLRALPTDSQRLLRVRRGGHGDPAAVHGRGLNGPYSETLKGSASKKTPDLPQRVSSPIPV